MTFVWTLSKPIVLFSCLIFILAASLGAAERSPQGVQVTIGTILASNQNDEFDPRLKDLNKQLKVMKYRSYRLLKEESQNVAWRGEAVFELPGGRSLVVVPQEIRNKRLGLKVRLLAGENPLLDTTVTLGDRGNFLLGGPEHEGGVLIISITATAQ